MLFHLCRHLVVPAAGCVRQEGRHPSEANIRCQLRGIPCWRVGGPRQDYTCHQRRHLGEELGRRGVQDLGGPRLDAWRDVRSTREAGLYHLTCGTIGAHRRQGRRDGGRKPPGLARMLPSQRDTDVRAGAHQARGCRCDADAVLREFGAQRLGQADQRKFPGAVPARDAARRCALRWTTRSGFVRVRAAGTGVPRESCAAVPRNACATILRNPRRAHSRRG